MLLKAGDLKNASNIVNIYIFSFLIYTFYVAVKSSMSLTDFYRLFPCGYR